jgi:Tfp pilus assembly protein PilV
MKNTKAFTLIEAMVSCFILSFILLGVYGVLQTGNTLTTNDNALVDMQQQARNAMDRIVREVRESSTQTITTVSSNTDRIVFTTPNETGIEYYVSADNNLVRAYPPGTAKVVATNIGYLKFNLTGTSLTISVRAEKSMYGRTYSFPLVEKVRLRNE